MNTKIILDLTGRLTKALDSNYDVKDMETVIEVIAALEVSTITKEQLETTRLAKYINHLRRRTNCESLAKRAKSLLKKWREMVGMQQQITESTNIQQKVPSNTSGVISIDLFQTISNMQATSPTISTKSANTNVFNHRTNTYSLSDMQNESTSTNSKSSTNFKTLLTNISKENKCVGVKTTPGSNFEKKIKTIDLDAETLVIDNSSNSNSEKNFKYFSSQKTAKPPIVIDIQDSDSDSNNCSNEKSNLGFSYLKNTNFSPAVSTASKIKKLKKEKKKKDREFENNNPSIIIDRISILEGQNNPLHNTDTSTIEEKEINIYPSSNISEALSLSNSNNSLFEIIQQDQKDLNYSTDSMTKTGYLNNASTADLTFLGKFKHHSNPSNSNKNKTDFIKVKNKDDIFDFNDKNSSKIDCFNNNQKQKITKTSVFNDSLSNCPFDMLDLSKVNDQNNKKELAYCTETDVGKQIEKFSTQLQNRTTNSMSEFIKKDQFDLNNSNAIVIKKVPKKRGRKKGSRGVDSVIAKETSLSSQILLNTLGSGCKKVKTTKELYVEMQNRKLGATSSPPTQMRYQMSSRPQSSCSEPSLHSPRTLDACSTMSTVVNYLTLEKVVSNNDSVDADSDSDTIETSEKSHDSIKKSKCGVSDDTSNNIFLNSTKSKIELSKNIPVSIDTIEKQLYELLNKLPPVSNIKNIELQCSSDILQCICKVVEDTSQLQNDVAAKPVNSVINIDSAQISNVDNKTNFLEKLPDVSFNKISNEMKSSQIKSISKKPKKSIFDLDFEDDEDPLQIYLMESSNQPQQDINKASCSDIEMNIDSENISIDVNSFKTSNSTLVQQSFEYHYPKYRIEEDLNCLAKERFDIQTQKITQFHINALHNCYIPNVNGNWDHSNINNFTHMQSQEDILCNDGSDVVPRYGSLVNVRLPKDLSKIEFSKDLKSKCISNIEKSLGSSIFLGMAKRHKKLKNHKNAYTRNNQNNLAILKIPTVEHNNKVFTESNLMQDVKVDVDVSENHVNIDSTELVNNLLVISSNVKNEMNESIKNKNEIPDGNLNSLNKLIENDGSNKSTIISDNLTTHLSSDRSSNCSNCSLERTQQSINLKLKRHRLLQNSRKENEKPRKRNKKKIKCKKCNETVSKCLCKRICKVKRIKISINGGVATQRKISVGSSKNSTENEDEINNYCSSSSSISTICEKNFRSNEEDSWSNTYEDNKDLYFRDNDYGDYHEVITRDLSSNNKSNLQNHIILTIKKTPSKSNSPSYTLSSVSPVISNNENATNDLKASEDCNSSSIPNLSIPEISDTLNYSNNKNYMKFDTSIMGIKAIEMKNEKSNNENCYYPDRKSSFSKLLTTHNYSKYLQKHKQKTKNLNDLSNIKKQHNELFFPDELYGVDRNGHKHHIITVNSCSSSCFEESDDEYIFEQSSIPIKHKKVINSLEEIAFPFSLYSSSSIISSETETSESSTGQNSNNDTDDAENNFEVKLSKIEKELPLENNGLLSSFNNIYRLSVQENKKCKINDIKFINCNCSTVADKKCLHRQLYSKKPLQNENCDEYNILNNNNNNNLNLYKPDKIPNLDDKFICNQNNCILSSNRNVNDGKYKKNDENELKLIPHKEYQTGFRAVDEDVDDEEGNNCAHMQQFKEWHEILQLRTYKDELLTVLPYVVLE